MSLVVAQMTPDGPRIVSDTRISPAHQRRPSFKTGALKAVVVRRDITVCFAGEVRLGLDSIRKFARALEQERADDIDELLDMLQERASSGGDVEFLVATAMPESTLARVRPDTIEKDLPSAWIGDLSAFERFQQVRLGPNPMAEFEGNLPLSAKVMATLQRSMQAVIEDPAVNSVDDFCVSIANRPAGFEYLGSVFVYIERDFEIRPGEDLVSKMIRPVEEGSYAVAVVEPAEPGTPALGLCFPRARLAMLHLPLQYDQVQVIPDVSPNDFAQVALERFGVAMKQPGILYREPERNQ